MSGDKTLGFYAVAWNGKTAALTISVDGTEVQTIDLTANAGAAGSAPFTMTVSDSDYYTVALTGLKETSTIKFETKDASNGRAVVFGVKLF